MLAIPNTRASERAVAVGDVVAVRLLNALENRKSEGKTRPAVLVKLEAGHWLAMGLTTRPIYADGSARTPIPNYAAVGLLGPGFLWGERLARISRIDVLDRFGTVDRDLAEAVIRLARLDDALAAALRDAAIVARSEGGAK